MTQIEPGSPAEQAGIQPGDVIVAINGKPIDSSADLRNEIGLIRAGDSVEVTSIRDGERRTVRATVAAETGGGAASARAADPASVSLLAGATIMELPSDHPAYGRVQGRVGQRGRAGLCGRALRPACRRRHHGRQPRADRVCRRTLTAALNRRQAADCAASAARRALAVLARALTRVARELQSAVRFEIHPQQERK